MDGIVDTRPEERDDAAELEEADEVLTAFNGSTVSGERFTNRWWRRCAGSAARLPALFFALVSGSCHKP